MNKNNNKINYIYKEEFKTNNENVTTNELIKIFNEKIFKTIMKIEKYNLDDCIFE